MASFYKPSVSIINLLPFITEINQIWQLLQVKIGDLEEAFGWKKSVRTIRGMPILFDKSVISDGGSLPDVARETS